MSLTRKAKTQSNVPLRKTSVSLPVDMYRQLKQSADYYNMSLSLFITSLLEQIIELKKNGSIPKEQANTSDFDELKQKYQREETRPEAPQEKTATFVPSQNKSNAFYSSLIKRMNRNAPKPLFYDEN